MTFPLFHFRLGSIRLADPRTLEDDEHAQVVHPFERRALLRAWLEDQTVFSTTETERLWDALGLELSLLPAGVTERLELIDAAFEREGMLGTLVLVRDRQTTMAVISRKEEEVEARAPEPERTDLFEARVFWRPGKPLVETLVQLVSPEGRQLAQGQTDHQGWVRFPGKFPPDCTVECLSLPVAFNRTLHLCFIGADRHSPMKGEEVTFTEWGDPQSATTDDEGIIRVSGLTDTFYHVKIAGKELYVPTTSGGSPVRVVVDRKEIEVKTEALEDWSEGETHGEELWEDDEVDFDHLHSHDAPTEASAEPIAHDDGDDDDHDDDDHDDDDDDGVWPDHTRPGWAA